MKDTDSLAERTRTMTDEERVLRRDELNACGCINEPVVREVVFNRAERRARARRLKTKTPPQIALLVHREPCPLASICDDERITQAFRGQSA